MSNKRRRRGSSTKRVKYIGVLHHVAVTSKLQGFKGAEIFRVLSHLEETIPTYNGILNITLKVTRLGAKFYCPPPDPTKDERKYGFNKPDYGKYYDHFGDDLDGLMCRWDAPILVRLPKKDTHTTSRNDAFDGYLITTYEEYHYYNAVFHTIKKGKPGVVERMGRSKIKYINVRVGKSFSNWDNAARYYIAQCSNFTKTIQKEREADLLLAERRLRLFRLAQRDTHIDEDGDDGLEVIGC